jgi:hypothetical protein
VEACLYRHFHSQSPRTGRAFGWNALPASFGVSPATANRRYNEWLADGTWGRVWEYLLRLRAPAASATEAKSPTHFPAGESPLDSPVAPAIVWLELAYRHFNAALFGGTLPLGVVISLESRPPRTGLEAYFCPLGWRLGGSRRADHIMVTARAWAEGTEAALAALLHEAVHVRCHGLGLPDTSRRQYHNRHFRDTALVSGLRCPSRHPQYGYVGTEPDERGRAAIEAFLVALSRPR